MILLLISFIAGILTVLAPCVLPVLPVIIGGSVSGDSKEKARPYIIGLSLTFSIIFFTLLLKASTILVNLSPDFLNWLSGGLLIVLGAVTLFPELWEKIVIYFNWEATSMQLLGKSQKNKSKYISAILIGVALGPVFASCSPTYAFILASILPSSFLAGFIYLATYAVGLALALLAISLLGRKFISRFPWAINTHSLFRRLLGALFVLIGIIVLMGLQVKIETWVADHLPFDETKIEQVLLSRQQSSPFKSQATTASSVLNVQPSPAPEFQGLTNWINSSPLTMASLRGKVVLVDFWTYSCINCIRSIPFVEKWYQTYQDQGLVIVGVNTPEFAFEHNPTNVAAAVKNDGITYPVALDNNYSTWNAFNNNSWPADYLIDKQGNIRYISFGEGGYDTTEKAIQELLGIKKPLQMPSNYVVPATASQTPETYFGTARASNYIGRPAETDVTGSSATFTSPPAASLNKNEWSLGGNWKIQPDSITSNDDQATLTFHVSAKDVYVVASPSGVSATVQVKLPSANANQFGSDAPAGMVSVGSSKLYHIVSLNKAGDTTVTLTVPKGVSLFTFTFGS